MKNKAFAANALLLLLLALENLCLYCFFRQGILTQGKNAILLFLSSVLFGVALLYKFYNAQVTVANNIPRRPKNDLMQ